MHQRLKPFNKLGLSIKIYTYVNETTGGDADNFAQLAPTPDSNVYTVYFVVASHNCDFQLTSWLIKYFFM